jgi:hypothetical protein
MIAGIFTVHVCRTGKKEQFYTLYYELIGRTKFGSFGSCRYLQNLAHDLADAMDKAQSHYESAKKRWAHNENVEVRLEVHQEPRPIYVNFEAFGLEFKMAASRKVWWSKPNKAFWDLWKQEKQAIKEAGYWVKRMDDGGWCVFQKVPQEVKDLVVHDSIDAEVGA